MNIQELFMQRYEALHPFYLASIWENVSHEQMRQAVHDNVNTIAWLLWHVIRVEDAGMNRIVADRQQILHEGDWNAKMGLSIMHHGTGMTREAMLELSKQIDLSALQAYSQAVNARTQDIVRIIDSATLDDLVDEAHRLKVLGDEGVANPTSSMMLEHAYKDWTIGKCLMHFGQTHTFEHIGEMVTLASMMDVSVFGF